MVRGRVLITQLILPSILPVFCCTCHCVNHCVTAPWSRSSLTGMSRQATAWFLVGKDRSLQNHHCVCAFAAVKSPVAGYAMEMGFSPLKRSLEISVVTHQHVLCWQWEILWICGRYQAPGSSIIHSFILMKERNEGSSFPGKGWRKAWPNTRQKDWREAVSFPL